MNLLIFQNRFYLLSALFLLTTMGTARSQIFVVTNDALLTPPGNWGSGNSAILEYDFNGTYKKPYSVPMPGALAASGTDLFVASLGSGTIAKITTSGQLVDSALISGLTILIA